MEPPLHGPPPTNHDRSANATKGSTINASAGGTSTGAGTYDLNTTTNLVATPSLGYLFMVGQDLTSSDSNVSITLSANQGQCHLRAGHRGYGWGRVEQLRGTGYAFN